MLGIICYGEVHEKRVREIIERLTPEVYLLLLQAQGIVCKYIEIIEAEREEDGKDGIFELANMERAFVDKVRDLLGQTRLPDEKGEQKMIYFDITYIDKNGVKIL